MVPCVFQVDPVFSTTPRVFHQTPCFPHPVFSTRPCVFHAPCFPPDPVFSTPRGPIPRDPVPRTPGSRPRVFHLAQLFSIQLIIGLKYISTVLIGLSSPWAREIFQDTAWEKILDPAAWRNLIWLSLYSYKKSNPT